MAAESDYFGLYAADDNVIDDSPGLVDMRCKDLVFASLGGGAAKPCASTFICDDTSLYL